MRLACRVFNGKCEMSVPSINVLASDSVRQLMLREPELREAELSSSFSRCPLTSATSLVVRPCRSSISSETDVTPDQCASASLAFGSSPTIVNQT